MDRPAETRPSPAAPPRDTSGSVQVALMGARAVCVECACMTASDEDEAYCAACGSRVPEPFELLAWETLRAAEEAGQLDRRSRSLRVA